jgi:hypothetical protein
MGNINMALHFDRTVKTKKRYSMQINDTRQGNACCISLYSCCQIGLNIEPLLVLGKKSTCIDNRKNV